MDASTLKRAAAELERNDLVSRKVRPNKSNIWYINVGKLQTVALENRATLKSGKSEVDTGSPFAMPMTEPTKSETAPNTTPSSASTDAEAEDVDLMPEPSGKWSKDDISERVSLFSDHFADHPTYQLPNGTHIMGQSVRACLDLAGSIDRYDAVIDWALIGSSAATQKRISALASSRYLGGLLKKVFPVWTGEV